MASDPRKAWTTQKFPRFYSVNTEKSGTAGPTTGQATTVSFHILYSSLFVNNISFDVIQANSSISNKKRRLINKE
jgi:hypothetical protein